MNIIVLAGGISTEREVSIVTGTRVCQALKNAGHHAALLDVYFGTNNPDVFAEDDSLEKRVDEIKQYSKLVEEVKSTRTEFFGEGVIALCQSADIVFMALHGENGENGKVQAAFDLFGIRYTGTNYLGSAIAMDKSLSKSMFLANGINTPHGITMHKFEKNAADLLRKAKVSFPCIVKPNCGGSSVGIKIVSKEQELEEALQEAFALEDEVVIEEYIKGREFSVGVVNGEAYPVIEIRPKEGFYDYVNKYEPGKTDETCPADLSEELTVRMQQMALEAANALQLDKYSRMDFMMDEKNNIYCLEANTLPGMTPTSLLPQEAAAIGMSYEDLCEKLIETSL